MTVAEHDEKADAAGDAAVRTLHDLVNGFWTTHVLHAAVTLGLPDLLAEGPVAAGALAQRCDADAAGVARLLRALAAIGLCTVDGDGRWSLSPLGRGLRTGAPGGAAERARIAGRYFSVLWQGLPDRIRVGSAPPAGVSGPALFEHLGAEPELAVVFDRLMAAQTDRAAHQLVAVHDLSWARTIVDVGGGTGRMLEVLLEAHPEASGVVFDLPEVAERARSALATVGLAERCTAVGGDFFVDVPAGGDLYVLSFILHDWDDEHAVAILRACRRAMTPDARLVVFEQLLPEQGVPDRLMAYYDLHMLVVNGGRERSVGEYRELFARAGFRLVATTPTDGTRHVIEARPVA